MTPGERRMARRMIRAGLVLGPVLAAPINLIAWIFSTKGRFFFTLGVLAIGCGFTACVVRDTRLRADATPAEITAALKGNWCVTELMPRRQADFNRPLTNRDLLTGQIDCEKAIEDATKLAAQKAAMKALTK